ncbi:MAG TPA: riboflavin synthase, partial [Thermoleophilaceae bacterium]|nr:riboflavin synthase [Thermoleophilaceae bacterium]
MFTGLVAGTGVVESLERGDDGVRLRVLTDLAGELHAGDSVAVNGVCLTAVESHAAGFSADVMAETLRRSSLGPLNTGDEVNLELPLRAGDRLGGHMVQGHVDGTGRIEAVGEDGFARVLRIGAPRAVLR